MNTPFTATDCLLHPHCHARPPKLVLQQRQCLPLALMSCIPMAPIHGHYSISHGDYKPHIFLWLSGQGMAVVEGTLMEHEFLPFPKDDHTLFHHSVVPQKMLEILYFMGGNPLHHNFEYGIFLLCSTQSITCKFTCMWVACAWTVVYSTCLCIFSLASATVWSWASALPKVPTVTPSRMDFTASVFNFDATQLRTYSTALSLPFWYLILNVNPASDSIQQCLMGSKLRVVKM